MEGDDRVGQADEHHGTRIADPAMDAILPLAPAYRRFAELVRDELDREGLALRSGARLADSERHDQRGNVAQFHH